MAQTIKIKRTTGTGKDSSVEQGELFYAYGSGGTYGKRLAIGHVNGGGNTPEIIGGSLFMDMLDHTAGTITASSAILVDSNKKIDELKIGNSSNAGKIELFEASANGTNAITIISPSSLASDLTYTLPGTVTNGQFLTTDGSGNLSFSAISTSFTIAADSGSNDTFNTGETLTFAGTANEIETTVSNNQITIGLPTNVTISGNLTVSGTTTTVSSTTVNVADSMLIYLFSSSFKSIACTKNSINRLLSLCVTAHSIPVSHISLVTSILKRTEEGVLFNKYSRVLSLS